MRLVPLLLVTFALVLAGCASKDNGTTTTTTTPTTTTTSSTTSTTPTTSTTTPTTTTPTAPTKPAPMEITATADFASNTGPPPGPPAAKPFTIPAGYTLGNLTVKWTCPTPVCLNSAISVKAAGLTCTLDSGAQSPPNCVKEGPVTPGEGKFDYTGEGAVTATITLHLT